MPFTYELPVPILDGAPADSSVHLEEWLVKEGTELHRDSPVAVISASGIRYEIRANGNGFIRKRLVRCGDVVSPSSPLAIIVADGENIPYGKPYSVAHRLAATRRRTSLKPRWWRSIKRFFNTRTYFDNSDKARRQGFVARMILLGIFFAFGIYYEAPIIWWFLLASIACGVLIAMAIRRFRA